MVLLISTHDYIFKWSLLYTRLIYSKGPRPYIAILTDPSNDLFAFESIDPCIPVLGVTPATDGTHQ